MVALGNPVLGASQTVLVLGDSLSAAYGLSTVDKGWVALLQQRLAGAGDTVLNSSIPGDTTAGGLSRLPSLLDASKPSWVLVELGANDGLRGLSPAQMKANLREIIAQSRHSGARVLLIGIRVPPNYGRNYAEAFQRVFPALAEEASVPLVPFLLEGVGGRAEFILPDGLHPNELAQPILFENVWRVMSPLIATDRPK
jgi:acyl-CoA thioesterase-1